MTRGERNNNPMNIRQSDEVFQGEVNSDDLDFKAFSDPVMGIRAGAKILLNYYRLHGLNTIASIISRWAPDSENNTTAYQSDVAARLGVGSDQPITLSDSFTLTAFATAIIWHENGECIYTLDQISQAINLALA